MTPTERLLAALLPAFWRDRAALLAAARRLDLARGDGELDDLLQAWTAWRATGALPANAVLRDLVAALVTVLGGVGPELRLRPRVPAAPATASATDRRSA